MRWPSEGDVVEQRAFKLSERYNDGAPLGWERYVPRAKQDVADGFGDRTYYEEQNLWPEYRKI